MKETRKTSEIKQPQTKRYSKKKSAPACATLIRHTAYNNHLDIILRISIVIFALLAVTLFFLFIAKKPCATGTIIKANTQIGGLKFNKDITYDELIKLGIVYGPTKISGPSAKMTICRN